ncbi:Protein CBG12353 [Caenorhabditis briggsae]|uniref:Protein CBG12353 n=1 Tax=Caenorhabditis briggsae TaxID=6238 RepID=A8XF83_CAEBR|nr:Protein CBG12353 [Caenorhabditis briggsae]CAP31344.2 Protein CBG12353 [Caenorhabditis briggsae]
MPSKSAVTSKMAFLTMLPCVIVITLFCLAVPLTMITIGITKMDDCEADPRIPIWMIVIAVRETQFSEDGGNDTLVDWKNRRKNNKSTLFAFLGSFVRLIQFVAFVVGCFWVFGIYSDSDRCNGYVFWTSYFYCLISIIFYIVGACVLGCVCCCIAVLSSD